MEIDEGVEKLRPNRPVDRAGKNLLIGNSLPDLLDLTHCLCFDAGESCTGRLPMDNSLISQSVAVEIFPLRRQRERRCRCVELRSENLAVDDCQTPGKPIG